MNLAFHVRLAGFLLLMLAVLNALLPRHFGWKAELQNVSLLSRQVFLVHLLFIILILVLMGVLGLVFTAELLAPTRLGRIVLAGLTLFWAVRLFVQFGVYDSALWKGKRFNSAAHIVFSVVWVYLTAIFGWALVGSRRSLFNRR